MMGRSSERLLARVAGSSMRPLFDEKDLVWIVKSKPKFGDVILFVDFDNQKTLHRYISVFGKTITAGDANKFIDANKIKKIIGVADNKESLPRKLYFSLRILLLFLSKRPFVNSEIKNPDKNPGRGA